MTKALVLDGKAIADGVIARVAAETRALIARGVKPGLAVVLVGEDPASQSYVAGKGKAAEACGFHSVQHTLPATTSEAELLALVAAPQRRPGGARHSRAAAAAEGRQRCARRSRPSIRGRTSTAFIRSMSACSRSARRAGRSFPAPRPGAMIMLDRACEALGTTLAGKEAVVIGRSNIVGKPMAQLLLSRHCTVTIAHSRTRDLPAVARRADILVAAVGQPEMVRGSWVKPGAIVIDVGINRVPARGSTPPAGRRRGSSATSPMPRRPRSPRAITPVPGGVGKMTIAMLMANTLEAAKRAVGPPAC